MDSHGERQKILTDYDTFLSELEQITALLSQMMQKKYHSLDVYINNCNHLKISYLKINRLLAEESFSTYLKTHHDALYNKYTSLLIGIRLYENLLTNCGLHQGFNTHADSQ
ncbi:hypothetical protein J5069_13170 [Candidatus Symbiopectobacterium sp. NZEC127]|uniref:hypothetical protein n=1 Tax=Candidatus Symbiopectobacterium sp. NZEC127 TaxID=2820472 RepID=UPI002227957A|nr:hypothetical protein [Candidatus Symbiopectobacterium sp. NZEC127]MCW2486844.1 hypothetical protein [Candidatus Symbiopectobacterium sp. NZEC127]